MRQVAFVRAIAERFVFRQAAPAKRYYRSALQAIGIALHVHYFEIAYNFQ
jgi:hypothetical protein